MQELFDIDVVKDEDYQDAAEQLFGIEQQFFGDTDDVEVEDLFDIDQAVEQLYTEIYGGTVNA